MKRSEMNAHQRTLFDIMSEVMSDLIGGSENTMMDEPEGSEDYVEAYNYLHQGREALVEDVYTTVMYEVSKRGATKAAKFAGREFLLERINNRLNKWGY